MFHKCFDNLETAESYHKVVIRPQGSLADCDSDCDYLLLIIIKMEFPCLLPLSSLLCCHTWKLLNNTHYYYCYSVLMLE